MGKLLKVIFGLFLLVYFVVAVVSRTPAKVVAGAIVNAAPGVTLGSVSGTAWNGRAGAATVQLPGKLLDLGGVRWKISPAALLGLNLCVDLDSGLLRGNVCRSLSGSNQFSQVFVDDFPMSMLGDMIGAELAGTGNVTIQKAVIDDAGTISDIKGNVTWMRARGNGGGGWYPLGSFAAELSPNGNGGIHAHVVDVDGEFEVKLDGEVGVKSLPKVLGTIKPRANAPQILVDTLMVFTELQDDGTYKLTWPIGGG